MKFHEALERTLVSDTGIGIFRHSWAGNESRATGGAVARWVAPISSRAEGYREGIQEPSLFISGPDGIAAWTPEQADIFADDWDAL